MRYLFAWVNVCVCAWDWMEFRWCSCGLNSLHADTPEINVLLNNLAMNQFTYWPFSGLDCCLINAFSVANRFDAIANAFAMKWSLNRFFFALAYVYNLFFFSFLNAHTIGGPSLRKSVCHLVHTLSNPIHCMKTVDMCVHHCT